MPPTQLSSRLALRLGQLPHGVLAELAARLCSESPALEAAAEECMAAHHPLPYEMVERVLLSPDLVPRILGPLEVEDGAAAAVCSQWLDGWKATNEPRRWLKPEDLDIDFPEELNDLPVQMAATPDGRLVADCGHEVVILDRSMRVLQKVAGGNGGFIASSDDSIFHVDGDGDGVEALRRVSHNGTAEAEYQLDGYGLSCPVLAPGGLLFCLILVDGGGERDEIIALDAQTLQLRHRFGLGLLNHALQLAVGGDELYVCDSSNDRLQVFSFTGEHSRSIVGEWRRPMSLCFAKDRLYLVEVDSDGDDTALPVQGRRILVLSLQGDILQVWTHPTEPTATFDSMCCFDRKLLATHCTIPYYRVLALQGL